MIRVYFLSTKNVQGVETCEGSQYIHQAILGVEGIFRKLIQDTTDAEHTALVGMAQNWRDAMPDEAAQLAKMLADFPPGIDWQTLFDTAPTLLDKVKVLAKKAGINA